MQFTDAVTVAGTRRTEDGYLIAEAFAVRTGVQHYVGSEIGMADRATVAIYRPEDEVKSLNSLRTFSHAPVTMGHPKEQVTADNWKQLAVGEVSTEAEWKDGKVRLPLILKDAAAIIAVERGTRELSAGYRCRLDVVDGVAPDGTPYQAIQRDITINHLAIVPKGRAGPEFRIGDDAGMWGVSPLITKSEKGDKMSDALKTVVLGDKAVQVAVADVAAIEAFKADAATKLADAETKHQAAIAAKDAELAKAHAERDAAKAKVLDAADLDKLVQARADLISTAKAIAKDVKTDGLTDAEIRKAVVTAKLGDAAVKDKADAYIDARFDILAEDATTPTDTFREAVKGGLKPTGNAMTDADQAWGKSVADLNAWRKEA